MKTQIIALEAHDDFISVRDRMSWAKSPRILLVWPKFEKITLRAADLRILQQHAASLGAQLGVITRRSDVRRDAERFGIPVFNSTASAQRQAWPGRRPSRAQAMRRPRKRPLELEELKEAAHAGEAEWRSRPAARIGFFVLGVLAVLIIAAIFMPVATVRLTPVSRQQDMTLPISASKSIEAVSLAGSVPAHEISVTTGDTLSARVATQTSIPDRKATGIARFTNLTQSDVTIPAGTIVYSLSPAAVQFATLNNTHLAGNVNAIVEVPIASVNGGAEGNLPANAIQAVQGNLSLSVAVTNPQPTTGGSDRVTAAPSDADRQRLHDVLLGQLKAKAQGQIAESIGAKDVMVLESMKMGQVVEETYDPPAGMPGNLLKLTMRVEFSAQYVRAADLAQLAKSTLEAGRPQGFTPASGSMAYDLTQAPTVDAAGVAHFGLRIRQTLVSDLDLPRAAALVSGKSPQAAAKLLQADLPLAEAPQIKVSPAWWPWMPLVPFRIAVTTNQ